MQPDAALDRADVACAALGIKEAAGAAALALRELCDSCGAALAPYLDALMALYQAFSPRARPPPPAAHLWARPWTRPT
jgi:hypothetical protein